MADLPSVSDIEAVLRGVVDPELGGDVIELGMVPAIDIDADGAVVVHLALTIAACPMRDQIEGDVVRKVESTPGVTSVRVEVTAMT